MVKKLSKNLKFLNKQILFLKKFTGRVVFFLKVNVVLRVERRYNNMFFDILLISGNFLCKTFCVKNQFVL